MIPHLLTLSLICITVGAGTGYHWLRSGHGLALGSIVGSCVALIASFLTLAMTVLP